ncbi:MAG TPA: F0F1 ATP synthase subunit B [Rhodocyclaceae bacterium]|nr:F0F1 ATP synthase subunit B [Rhodocyclaceae bacterium]
MNINATLLGQAIWFGFFIVITMKYIWPPLQRAMHERQKLIADGLADAERAKVELDLAGKRSADVIRDGKGKSAEIVAQAEKRAQQLIEEAKETAKLEAERIKVGAKAEIDQEALRAKEQLRERVAELAVAGAAKILRREVDAKAHAELLGQLRQEL